MDAFRDFPQKKVAAVVVTYNRCDLLLENIEALQGQTAASELDIFIIDNASTDGTRERLRTLAEDGAIVYLNTGANLGGAGGFQYGIREATERGYEFVWVMDDDCIPEPAALEGLLGADESLGGDYGFLSSKVLWKDRSICLMNVQRDGLGKDVKDFESPLVPVIMASFVSCFIRASVVREVGLPFKEFFVWTDDWEYTRRISIAHRSYLVNKSVVVHKSAKNLGASIVDETPDRLDRFERMYRNDVVLYRREGARGLLYEAARLSGHTFRVLLKARDHKGERLGAIWRGTAKGLSFHPAIEFCREARGD